VAFSLESYARIRPFLYHTTAPDNLARIRATGQLESAGRIRADTPAGPGPRLRRKETLPVITRGGVVLIRDQAPLHEGNITFTGGWGMATLLEELDRRVFFWPGTEKGPIDYGLRHFLRYRSHGVKVLRVSFQAILRRNPGAVPYFSRFNSGSPRFVNGRPSPRGADTFQRSEQCDYAPGRVVEVTFLDCVLLPYDTEVSDHIIGPWQPYRE
jgi:hypothetical protein